MNIPRSKGFVITEVWTFKVKTYPQRKGLTAPDLPNKSNESMVNVKLREV